MVPISYYVISDTDFEIPRINMVFQKVGAKLWCSLGQIWSVRFACSIFFGSDGFLLGFWRGFSSHCCFSGCQSKGLIGRKPCSTDVPPCSAWRHALTARPSTNRTIQITVQLRLFLAKVELQWVVLVYCTSTVHYYVKHVEYNLRLWNYVFDLCFCCFCWFLK